MPLAGWCAFKPSSECRRRQELGQFIEITEVQFDQKDRPDPRRVIPKAKTKDKLPPESDIIQATHRETLTDLVSARKWYEGALDLEGRLAAHGDLFARDVPTNLCLAAARRQLGKAEESQRWFIRYITETTVPLGAPTAARGADPWRECVLLESWLMNRAGQAIAAEARRRVPSYHGTAVPRRQARRRMLGSGAIPCPWRPPPATWASSSVARRRSNGSSATRAASQIRKRLRKRSPTGTRAAFAFDDEHLYVAVVCRHPAGMKKDNVEVAAHDMDLRACDRVSILIDLDRDYQTYYQLQIDQRGAVADDCWGDRTWNPKWFVAVHADETGWTAEVAIPLSELTGDVVAPGKLWAINVVRTVPGKGIQAWSGPAGVTPRPEGMGVLTFVGDQKK